MPYTTLLPLIFDRRTIFFVGAGLSFDEPTGIEGARELARKVIEKNNTLVALSSYFDPATVQREFQGAALAAEMAARFYADQTPRLEGVAEWFLRTDGNLRRFIDSIDTKIWELKAPNKCHFVLAKLMLEGLLDCLLTTNLDDRLEVAFRQIAESVPDHRLGVVTCLSRVTSEAGCRLFVYKIHGSLYDESKYDTIWTDSQLTAPAWQQGYEWARNVVADQIQAKSVVFVGFGTDVGYLNGTIRSLALDPRATQFYFVCPGTFAALQGRAPDLTTNLLALQATHHIPARGIDFADRLSRELFKKCLSDAMAQTNPILFKQGLFRTGGAAASHSQISSTDFQNTAGALKTALLQVPEPEQFQELLRGALRRWLPEDNKYHSFRHNRAEISELLHAIALLSFSFEVAPNGQRLPNLKIRNRTSGETRDILLLTGQNQASFRFLQAEVISQWQRLEPGTRVLIWNAILSEERMPAEELVTDITQSGEPEDITNGSQPVELTFIGAAEIAAAIRGKDLAQSRTDIGGLFS